MGMLYLLLFAAVLIALLVWLFRKRLWGLMLSLFGALAMVFYRTSHYFFTIMAENPGIMWENEAGVPYRDIYTGNAEKSWERMMIAGIVVLIGILWTVWQIIARRKKKAEATE